MAEQVMADEPPPRKRSTITQLLRRMVADPPPDGRVSLNDLMARAGRRGGAFLLLFLCLLSMIFSVVPGVSTVLGLPIIILSAQMAWGRRRYSLPGWIGRRSLDHVTLAQGLHARLGRLQKIENILRPRLRLFCSQPFLRVIGVASLLCSVVLALPIPGMNFPPTLAVFLMSLGVLGRDGLMVLAGLLITVAVLAVLTALAIFAPGALAELWQFLGFGG